ncbi:hypothetical protein [Microlunatus ginsengisoli]|uniref:DinB superfamily protein n=1 Tax=Microlunatus ginsengisoli TaxID=363863 RepID=A0ABP7AZM0_9ACTN
MVPLVDAELNRRFPGRELQKAESLAGLREDWAAVQSARRATVADTPADLADAHVEDEWSLAQTVRHLVLATDEVLGEDREGPWGGDWRPTVGDCIRVILEEEWAHLRYIQRDLALLR